MSKANSESFNAFSNDVPSAVTPSGRPTVYQTSRDNSRALKRRKSSILFVEDDECIRSITHAFLADAGYEVWACAEGLKALQVHSQIGGVDLLVSDIEMPHITGIELAVALTARQTSLRVILNSASALTQQGQILVSRKGWQFLRKPFRVNHFLEAVGDEMNALKPKGQLRGQFTNCPV
jgi:two-component system cell cycle sensor histidine kinase/response regulator CckA